MGQLEQEINESCGSLLSAPIVSLLLVSGGSINQVYRALLADKTSIVVKLNREAGEEFFVAEAKGLALLETQCCIRVPKALGYRTLQSSGRALLLEFLAPAQPSHLFERELGISLAKLHQVNAPFYGLEFDNFIGTLHQSNTTHKSWGKFFLNERLDRQMQLAQKLGWAKESFIRSYQQKREAICQRLDYAQASPTVLHGDLWTGNVYWSIEGPALIDPAVYYGDREADIAFSQMFGSLSSRVYRAYEEVAPLSPGFQIRKKILNLYHELTHANMFGGSYCHVAIRTVTELN